MGEENNLIQIYASSAQRVDQLKVLLEEMGIPTFVKNEVMGQMFPIYASPGGIDPVKIFVDEKDLKEAKKIIENYLDSES